MPPESWPYVGHSFASAACAAVPATPRLCFCAKAPLMAAKQIAIPVTSALRKLARLKLVFDPDASRQSMLFPRPFGSRFPSRTLPLTHCRAEVHPQPLRIVVVAQVLDCQCDYGTGTVHTDSTDSFVLRFRLTQKP